MHLVYRVHTYVQLPQKTFKDLFWVHRRTTLDIEFAIQIALTSAGSMYAAKPAKIRHIKTARQTCKRWRLRYRPRPLTSQTWLFQAGTFAAGAQSCPCTEKWSIRDHGQGIHLVDLRGSNRRYRPSVAIRIFTLSRTNTDRKRTRNQY